MRPTGKGAGGAQPLDIKNVVYNIRLCFGVKRPKKIDPLVNKGMSSLQVAIGWGKLGHIVSMDFFIHPENLDFGSGISTKAASRQDDGRTRKKKLKMVHAWMR